MRLSGDSTFARAIAFACLILNLGVAGVVPALDAILAGDHEPPELHVEAETRVPCAPGHDDLFCQLCRAYDRQVVTPLPAQPPPFDDSITSALRQQRTHPLGRLADRGNEARAPPPPSARTG